MTTEHILQLIGIAIFLIITSLTYGIMTPVNEKTNTLLEAVTTKITNITANTTANITTNATINTTTNTTTNTIDDTSRLTNNYRIMTAITVGGVIAIVIIFFLGSW